MRYFAKCNGGSDKNVIHLCDVKTTYPTNWAGIIPPHNIEISSYDELVALAAKYGDTEVMFGSCNLPRRAISIATMREDIKRKAFGR